LFDVAAGGTIAAHLQVDGWTVMDQRVNNNYQLFYGLLVAAAGGWFYFSTKSKRMILALVILFAGYVEDTLFYVFIPIVNPLIKIFSGGRAYQAPAGLFPERISGWVGWVGRILFGHNVSFEMSVVFVINMIAILSAFLLLRNSR
jgi:hypothetical protein